jgi:2-methylaconitate cis-trans-isomerase PrpF
VAIERGHPGGAITVESEAEIVDGSVKLKRAAFYRTARKIMEGYVFVKKTVFK